jgi:hypothetical protein
MEKAAEIMAKISNKTFSYEKLVQWSVIYYVKTLRNLLKKERQHVVFTMKHLKSTFFRRIFFNYLVLHLTGGTEPALRKRQSGGPVVPILAQSSRNSEGPTRDYNFE